MNFGKKTFSIFFLTLFFLTLFFYFFKIKSEQNKIIDLKPITINLITNVHPKLNWNFTSLDSKILVKPGDVTNIEYMVENLGNKETTGIATFAYFPNQFGNYISRRVNY